MISLIKGNTPVQNTMYAGGLFDDGGAARRFSRHIDLSSLAAAEQVVYNDFLTLIGSDQYVNIDVVGFKVSIDCFTNNAVTEGVTNMVYTELDQSSKDKVDAFLTLVES